MSKVLKMLIVATVISISSTGALLPVAASDQEIDLTAFSIDKITPFGVKKSAKRVNKSVPFVAATATQPTVQLSPGDVLVLKLSKTAGCSDYGPCHLESSLGDVQNKIIESLGDNGYIALSAGQAKIIIHPAGPGIGMIEPSLTVPVTITALSNEQEVNLLKTSAAQQTNNAGESSVAIDTLESDINGLTPDFARETKNRNQLLHAYMFALARRAGKSCIPFLAGVRDADASAEALKHIKMLTEDDFAKSSDKPDQSWETWWQKHATSYGAVSK